MEVFEGSGWGGEVTQERFFVRFGDVTRVAGKVNVGDVREHFEKVRRRWVTCCLMLFVDGLGFDVDLVG
jgi:hypothetical protein